MTVYRHKKDGKLYVLHAIESPAGKKFIAMAYRHDGFWQCMDTAHDHARLERLWAEGAPWAG